MKIQKESSLLAQSLQGPFIYQKVNLLDSDIYLDIVAFMAKHFLKGDLTPHFIQFQLLSPECL